jgi:hypothetical protein
MTSTTTAPTMTPAETLDAWHKATSLAAQLRQVLSKLRKCGQTDIARAAREGYDLAGEIHCELTSMPVTLALEEIRTEANRETKV